MRIFGCQQREAYLWYVRNPQGSESGDNRGSVPLGECSLVHASLFLCLSLPVGENSSVGASPKPQDFLFYFVEKLLVSRLVSWIVFSFFLLR